MAKRKASVSAWSFSRWSTFNKCPYQFKCKVLLKLPEEPSYASERGELIHKKGEQYLLGNIKQVPPEFKNFKDEMKYLKAGRAEPECDLAVTVSWKPTTYDDWSGVWCRGRADAVLQEYQGRETLAVDYKTGKQYDTHGDQAELMSLLTFSHYPETKQSTFQLYYLDSGVTEEGEIKRAKLKSLRKKWENRARKMITASKFDPKPGPQCRWCSFANSKGGPCPEG